MDKQKRSLDGKIDSPLVWTAGSFGDVIRRAREEAGLNQKQLAKACGAISPMYISQIEKGDRVPSVKVCRLLASVLDLDEERLLLLSHRFRAPQEIKDLLAREESEPNGKKADSRFMNLLKVVNQLPEDKKNKIAKVWEDALKLVV